MQLASSPIPAEAAAVAERPHWRFLVRPLVYDPDRIPTTADCWRRVQDCQVRLHGGLDAYPDLGEGWTQSPPGPDWVESCQPPWSYWRLYQSGQFVHHLRIPGTDDLDAARFAERVQRLNPPRHPRGLFEAYWGLDTLRAFLTFAGRLASRVAPGEQLHIEVSIRGVEEVLLFSDDLHWPPRRAGHFATRHEVAVPDMQVRPEQLLGLPDALAVDIAIRLYSQFGWEATPELLRRYIASRNP